MSNNSWRQHAELGNQFFIGLLVAMTRVLPRPLLSFCLWFISAYYLVLHRAPRSAAIHYWQQVQSRAPWYCIWKHFYTFARVSVDRLIMLKNGFAAFDIQFAPDVDFDQLRALNKGAIFLVNHLGNFDVLRQGAISAGLPRIKIVLDTRQNPQFMRLLSLQNPQMAADIIDVADGGYDLALKLADAVAQGFWVGIMADRIQAQEATTTVSFMGKPASVPFTPWQIASILGVPVYGCFGVFCGGNRYRIYLRKIADTLAASRKTRNELLHLNLHRYFAEVENIVRQYPYNWFNFYEFWSPNGN